MGVTAGGAGWLVQKEAGPGNPGQLSRWWEEGKLEKDQAACSLAVEGWAPRRDIEPTATAEATGADGDGAADR